MPEFSFSISGTGTTISASQAVVKSGGWRTLRYLPPLSANTKRTCRQDLFSFSQLELILHQLWTSFQPQSCRLAASCSERHHTFCK